MSVVRSSGSTVIRGTGTLNNVELRNLTVFNPGTAQGFDAAVTLTSVTGTLTVRNAALFVAATTSVMVLYTLSSNVNLVDTTVRSGVADNLGFGLLAEGTSVVRVTGGALGSNLAVRAFDSTRVFISGASVEGFPDSAIVNPAAKVAITASMIFAGVGGPVTCVASFDENLAPLAGCV